MTCMVTVSVTASRNRETNANLIARYSNTTVHGRMLRTHVTDVLHMTGSSTFFSSDQLQDWRATHCLRVTVISPPSVARQIKQYRRQNEFYPGVTAKCYIWLAVSGTHSVAANRRRKPRSPVYGKTRPSLLGLFGVMIIYLLYQA
jgi:hypothetical protein